MYHYTYKITFEGCDKTYFGVRTSKVKPEEDPYLGSPRTNKNYWKEYKPIKTILSIFETRKEAEENEFVTVTNFWALEGKEKSLNARMNEGGWNTLGRKRPIKEMMPSKIKCSKPYLFISPEGQIVEGVGLLTFCKENNLHKAAMFSVLKGKKLSYKGWTANFFNHLRVKYYGATSRFFKPAVLMHEVHGVKVVFNRNKFCKLFKVGNSDIAGVINGKYKKTNGWYLRKENPWKVIKNEPEARV